MPDPKITIGDFNALSTQKLPFAGLIDTPFRIYSGHLAGAEALRALLVQAAWVVALVAAGHRLMALGIRKVVIQGG